MIKYALGLRKCLDRIPDSPQEIVSFENFVSARLQTGIEEEHSPSRIFLFARNKGLSATRILPLDGEESIRVMRKNRDQGFQLGMIGGGGLDTAAKVYSEYLPFCKVSNLEELLNPFTNQEVLSSNKVVPAL
jgi:hypothetical protein